MLIHITEDSIILVLLLAFTKIGMIYILFLTDFVKSILQNYVCAFNSKVIVFAKFEQILEVDKAR